MAPTLKGGMFLADGGLETTLLFEDGLDLPCFAAFPLLDTAPGRAALRAYFARYLKIATVNGVGFVLDKPTWRVNADWGAKLGYDAAALDRINRDAVAFIVDLRAHPANAGRPIVLSAVVGPRGDGYVASAEIGIFGVGGKRTGVALGEHVQIQTRAKGDKSLQLDITNDWLATEDWDLAAYEIPDITPGTTTVDIRVRLGATYQWFIAEGCQITLNRNPVKPIKFDSWAYPPQFKPLTCP